MSKAEKSSTIETRLATAEDLPALEANETSATEGLSATYLQEQEEGGLYVVVGLIDGEIAGRVLLDTRAEDEDTLVPEMKLLWVYPAGRRQGLGAAMTAHLEELAKELGYDEVFLGVTPDNPAAIPLYIGLGYTPTGEHRNALNVSVIQGETDINAEDPIEAIFRKSLLVR